MKLTNHIQYNINLKILYIKICSSFSIFQNFITEETIQIRLFEHIILISMLMYECVHNFFFFFFFLNLNVSHTRIDSECEWQSDAADHSNYIYVFLE